MRRVRNSPSSFSSRRGRTPSELRARVDGSVWDTAVQSPPAMIAIAVTTVGTVIELTHHLELQCSRRVDPAVIDRSPHSLMAVDTLRRPPVHSHQPLMGLVNTPSDLLPGTLELLVLKALVGGAK